MTPDRHGPRRGRTGWGRPRIDGRCRRSTFRSMRRRSPCCSPAPIRSTSTAVGSLGSDQRGLGGIEVALFGDDPTGARPCAYATSAAELVAATAATLAQEWAAGVDADAQQVVEELINGIVFTLGELADMRLGPASGSTTGAATPADVDAGPAHSALDDMLADARRCRRRGPRSRSTHLGAVRRDRRPARDATGQSADQHRLDPGAAGDGDRRRGDGKRLSLHGRGAHHHPGRGRQPARSDTHAR